MPGSRVAFSLRACATLVATLFQAAAGLAGTNDLVWHVEDLTGRDVSSQRPDEAVNPASVVKLATTLFVLERLGPEHRYETGFQLEGELDPSGRLDGHLLVVGGEDPDFHFESAVLAGWRLNEIGVRSVSGDLLVDDRFWMGWERGTEGRDGSPERRRSAMGERLRRALDPSRWNATDRAAWNEWRSRRSGLSPEPPRVEIGGGIGVRPLVPVAPHVVHRSNPLRLTLKRLLAYSNNDIERLSDPLGGPQAVERFVEERLSLEPSATRLETASGLGSNRMTSRDIVRLLRELQASIAAHGLAPGDLLPVTGCDPGSLEHTLPGWQNGPGRGATTAKTGTLIRQDGGVAALAGFLHGDAGPILYAVAAPASGHRIAGARADIERWLTDLAAQLGGPSPRPCPAGVEAVDALAETLVSGPSSD